MPGVKTNEREGTRAVLRHYRMSATKARQVLDLIRDQDVERAAEILRTTERDAGRVIAKVLASAVANAVHNDGQAAEDLYVAACYADEGATMKRWRPRARGRATRIRKRTCHITVIVARMPDERLARRRSSRDTGSQRSRRVSESRRRADLSGRLARRRTAAEEAAAAAAAAEAEAEAEAAEAAEAETEAGLAENKVHDGGLEDTEATETEATDTDEVDGEAEDPTEDEAHDAAQADDKGKDA
jgi:large subunit ribosomal protein L22